MENESLARISIHPDICHGKPTVRNTRMMVESVLEYIAGGDSIEELLSEFTFLEREDVLACISYASKVIHFKNTSFPVA